MNPAKVTAHESTSTGSGHDGPMNGPGPGPRLPGDADKYHRLPGLFRAWDLAQVVAAEAEPLLVTRAGHLEDGTQLHVVHVYRANEPGGWEEVQAILASHQA